MIPGCATRYHSIRFDTWILFVVVKIQLHTNGPKFNYLVDNIKVILSTSALRLFLFYFVPNPGYRT